ncbi:hypothetical protein LCGC14_2962770 [marine sediment metagenome]|uniref:Uncharacterized protein n=1 Tax=marine sediment metagenome TaxID=412755 RepID=A0A0F8XBP3_9ZZZZ
MFSNFLYIIVVLYILKISRKGTPLISLIPCCEQIPKSTDKEIVSFPTMLKIEEFFRIAVKHSQFELGALIIGANKFAEKRIVLEKAKFSLNIFG